MNIKNVIKTACLFLGKEDLENTVALGGQTAESASDIKELNMLLRCFNLVYSEIANDYVSLLHTEDITTDNGKIDYSNLSKNLLEVKSLTDQNGYRVNYVLYPGHILTKVDKVIITYSYEPDALKSYEDEILEFSKKVCERTLAYGVAMEYCFISGLYDDAQIWEKRFKDALLVKNRKKSEMRLPKRRWI